MENKNNNFENPDSLYKQADDALEYTDDSRQREYERQESEKNEALRLAYTDKMTGCYNRNYYEMIKDYKINKQKDNKNIALVHIDINDLGITNNSLGYKAGDQMITNVADLLKSNFGIRDINENITGEEFRYRDVLIRVGGDEFIITHYKTTEEQADDNFESKYDELIDRMIYLGKPKNLNFAWGTSVFDSQFDRDLDDTKNRAGAIMHIQKKEMKSAK